MENAVDALKMAAFVLLFVGAVSLAMITLSRARTTSQAILYSQDSRSRYTYVDESEYIDEVQATYKTERVVTFDAILPTLYRYYKENYRVEFYRSDGTPIGLYIPRGQLNEINALDIDTEMQNNEYWQGSPQATKEHLDKIVKDKLWSFRNNRFREELGIKEVSTTPGSLLLEDINKQTKRTIKYTVVY